MPTSVCFDAGFFINRIDSIITAAPNSFKSDLILSSDSVTPNCLTVSDGSSTTITTASNALNDTNTNNGVALGESDSSDTHAGVSECCRRCVEMSRLFAFPQIF